VRPVHAGHAQDDAAAAGVGEPLDLALGVERRPEDLGGLDGVPERQPAGPAVRVDRREAGVDEHVGAGVEGRLGQDGGALPADPVVLPPRAAAGRPLHRRDARREVEDGVGAAHGRAQRGGVEERARHRLRARGADDPGGPLGRRQRAHPVSVAQEPFHGGGAERSGRSGHEDDHHLSSGSGRRRGADRGRRRRYGRRRRRGTGRIAGFPPGPRPVAGR
jgi:hypothetical protein